MKRLFATLTFAMCLAILSFGAYAQDAMKETTIDVLGKEDVMDLIKNQWMLVTAGEEESFNTMTANWGCLGNLWNRPVAIIFVRPNRYTHQFMESSDKVTLSFYGEEYRKALQICGSKSGRNCNKVALAGLTPLRLESGAMTFSESRLTLDCHTLYKTDMDAASFLDPSIRDKYYSDGIYHTVYILEIDKVYEK